MIKRTVTPVFAAIALVALLSRTSEEPKEGFFTPHSNVSSVPITRIYNIRSLIRDGHKLPQELRDEAPDFGMPGTPADRHVPRPPSGHPRIQPRKPPLHPPPPTEAQPLPDLRVRPAGHHRPLSRMRC